MAIESVAITEGSGKNIAVDTIDSKEFQLVKISMGADGAHDAMVDSGQQTSANSLPVVLPSDWSLPAGTNAIGKLAANNGVDIGDVDVTTVTPGTGASNLGKAEDAVHSSGDVGVMILVVRQDSHSDLGADGDYVPMTVDADGGLRVSVTGSGMTVTNAGTFVVQVDGTALTRLTDIETNTDSGAVVGNGAAATAQRVTLANDSTGIVALTTSTASIGKLAANSGVDIGDVDIASIAAGDNNIGNVDIVTMPNVTLAAGTNTNEVVGDAAHGAAVAGNPLLTGLEGRSTAPTAVDDGDVVRALATLLGKQVVYPFALPANSWSYASPAAVTDTADDEVKAAVASTRHYITGLQVHNSHDTTGTEIVVKDGSTVLFRTWAQETGGGISVAFNPPLRGTANTAVNVANITNSSSTYFNLQGFSSSE